MNRFSPYQRAYLLGSSVLGAVSMITALSISTLHRPLQEWLLLLVLAIAYGFAWVQNEEFETSTANSPVLITVSDTVLIASLCLVGASAVVALAVAEVAARWWQRRGTQPLGYLFNFNQHAMTSVVTFAVLQLLTNGDPRALGVFPAGTIRFLLVLLVFESFDRASRALLEATGTGRPAITIIVSQVRPLALVTIIPSAMGLLIATAAVVAPGLIVPMLIPVILSRYAIRAIARWVQRHALLEQQVAEQTEAIRAQAAQIEAQEHARHQHTVLLVHDLEKEFRLGERLMASVFVREGVLPPGMAQRSESGTTLAEVAAIFERGLAMSADILLGSTLRAGQATAQLAPTNITALVATVTSRYLPIARAAEVQLTLDCDVVIELNADGPKLDRALANLLNNAIDYTKGCPERCVTVSLNRSSDMVLISVRDTGIGIAPEVAAQIGQRFLRIAGDQQEHHGNGLGLYGVAAIVGLHGGTIDVVSPGPHQGTTVTMKLPINLDRTPAVQLPSQRAAHPI
jgi:signal transduction histidine kinase